VIERMSLLQLGDVHFPLFSSQWTDVDNKDNGETANLPGHFSKPISSLIASAISAEMKRAKPAAIIVCGDLTDRGQLNGFDQAADYLAKAIGGSAFDDVHLLPGNHDVDLADQMPFVDLTSDRFEVLQSRLSAMGSPFRITKDSRETSHTSGTSTLFVTSLNTAKANGAPRLFPNITIKDPVAELLRGVDPDNLLTNSKKLFAHVSGSDPAISLQEVLDIPMIDPSDLDSVCTRGGEMKSGLFVVAAHHGFLPQATPRFGPYTEMVNGGQVRRRLLALDRPVLYLHGHIHQDSLEVIRGSGSTAGVAGPPLVSIAAPLLEDGFNRLDVEFTAEGRVLGILLYRLRVDRGTGGLIKAAPERIPIGARRTVPVHLRSFFTEMMSNWAASGEDFVRVGSSPEFALTAPQVEAAVVEAAWSGLIEPRSDPRDSFLEQEYTFR
jgi:hypothetical protein